MSRMSPDLQSTQTQLTADIDILLNRMKETHQREIILRNDLRNNLLDRCRYTQEMTELKQVAEQLRKRNEFIEEHATIKEQLQLQEQLQEQGQGRSELLRELSSSSSGNPYIHNKVNSNANSNSGRMGERIWEEVPAVTQRMDGDQNTDSSHPSRPSSPTQSSSSSLISSSRQHSFSSSSVDMENNTCTGAFYLSPSTPLSPQRKTRTSKFAMYVNQGRAGQERLEREIVELQEAIVQLTVRIEEGKQSMLLLMMIIF